VTVDAKKTAGIVLDEWKLPIFERHLKQSGYEFKNAGLLADGMLVLRVDTTNLAALGRVVKAANDEAAQTGAPK
jgi:hypothetical protein